MTITYKKNIEGELEKLDSKVISTTYTLEYLNEQKKQLEDNLIIVNNLIAEAVKVGVVLKIKV